MSETAFSGVQGSLDCPPMVIEAAIEKTILGLVICIVFVCGGAFIIAKGPVTHREYIGGYGGVLFFGLCSCIAVVRLIWPERLVLSPEGIVLSNCFKTQRYAWPEISRFVAYKPSARSISRHVGFIRVSRTAEESIWQKFAKGMTGVHGTFGNAWPISASELVDLLNEAKDRWDTGRDEGLTLK